MYEVKKNGNVFTSNFFETRPTSYKIKYLPGRGLTKVENTGLRRGSTPLGCWDYRVESRRGHGYLFLVNFVCYQVEVSVTVRSLVQRTPTECVCVCLCVSWSMIICNGNHVHLEGLGRNSSE